MSASDSRWHRQLSRLALDTEARERPYWLRPFQNYSTFCPYLVGDQETVAGELAAYLRRGVDTVILDIPQSREDLELSMSVIDAAAGAVT
jgi:alkanesulfonate monooxygenase